MAVTKLKVSVALTKSLVVRLDKVARAKEMSRSALIEDLVEAGIEEQDALAQLSSNPVVLQAFAQAFANRDVMRSMTQALREDLNDDQLTLFQQGMQRAMASFAEGPASGPRPGAAPSSGAEKRKGKGRK